MSGPVAQPWWLASTWRSTRWRPFVTAVGGSMVVAATLGLADVTAPAAPLLVLVAATIVSTAVVALDDPCSPLLLHALPTSGLRRVARRVALVAPPTAVAILGVDAIHRALQPTGDDPLGAGVPLVGLLALGLAALAVRAVGERRWPHRRGLAAAVPLGWALLALCVDGPAVVADVAQAWWRAPLAVIGAAVVAIVAAGDR